MKFLKICALTAVMAAMSAPAVSAQGQASFSFSDPNDQMFGWGNSKNETYNIAIRVSDPTMVGKKIVGMSVNAPYSENITNIKAFITTKLEIGKPEGATVKQNIADVCEVPATDNHGSYSATFPEPYTLTADGVFVGYTFTVKAQDAVSRQPVACTAGVNTDAFWVYTSRTFMSWKSRSEQLQCLSTIKVLFEGDFEAVSMGVEVDNSSVLMAGNSVEIPVTLINHGTDKISSLDYSIDIDGVVYNGTKTFSPALDLAYGFTKNISLEYNKEVEAGQKVIKVTINKVNGIENNDGMKSATVSMGILDFVPVKRTVMEEYTGLGCGYCPRGFAAMEYMNKKYGSKRTRPRFIALAYHNYTGDPMCTVSSNMLPNTVTGYPGCFLDRQKQLDPYYGTGSGGVMGIENDWLTLTNEFTPIDISLQANWDEKNPYQVNIVATTKLSREFDGTPKIAFYLVGDGMSDPSWLQSNYFSGNSASNFIPEMKQFCEGPKMMANLEFDDVVLMAGNTNGESTTLTGILPVNQDIVDNYSFDINYCRGLNTGINLALPLKALDDADENSHHLRVVALIVDRKTGKILNANTAKIFPFGVNDVAMPTAAEVTATDYYDLSGRRVANPANGLYIRVTTFNDGRRISDKVMMK